MCAVVGHVTFVKFHNNAKSGDAVFCGRYGSFNSEAALMGGNSEGPSKCTLSACNDCEACGNHSAKSVELLTTSAVIRLRDIRDLRTATPQEAFAGGAFRG